VENIDNSFSLTESILVLDTIPKPQQDSIEQKDAIHDQ
jgi:hypothetical protein